MQVVDASGDELIVATPEGARTIGPVAVALAAASIELRDLTLRTPTLDDVFLEMTGNRLRSDTSDSDDKSGGRSDHPTDPRHVQGERKEAQR